jgi:membrane associated rhomboid family serine protease
MDINLIIIGVTCLVSFFAFQNQELKYKLMHYPYREQRNGEKYRLLTSGFIHSDINHLIFNMITLYFFGSAVEHYFQYEEMFGTIGNFVYLFFYLVAIVAAGLYTHYKHKENEGYMALGASGAVAAVLFAVIVIAPLSPINFIFLPFFDIPGFIFGFFYLWYESYASKNSNDNIGHDAHFYGAIFGVLFVVTLKPFLIPAFFEQVMAKIQSFL